ncbi:MAG: hypothetical protein ABIF87_08020 [Pseudomonadota bacterium]
MDKFIIISLIVTALCAALVLFRIEARQKRTNVLKPSSYKFGLLGMVVYLVVYALLTVIEKMCFGIGKIPPQRQEDIKEEEAYTDWCFFSTGKFFPDIRDQDKNNWPS